MISKEQLSGNLDSVKKSTKDYDYTLVAVTKTHPVNILQNAYDLGIRDFGENKVQEIVPKHEELPKDIRWHFIGHLQRNKVKYIAPFVNLIHSVDSIRLLNEISKQGVKNNREIDCLLQIHIADEETKYGLDEGELEELLKVHLAQISNVRIKGLMGMATNTSDIVKVRDEFNYLKALYEKCKSQSFSDKVSMEYLSMGMSQDYLIALEAGSNMVRVGSTIFGPRNYSQ